MLISLNWLRDFVELPADVDPREWGERFTVTTAEVEKVRRIEVAAKGLIAARIVDAAELEGAHNLRRVTLDIGGGETVPSISAAPAIPVGSNVVYAPPGSSVAMLPEIGTSTVAGQTSVGLILPGEAIGVAMAAQEAVFLSPAEKPGDSLPGALFDDWLIEIDNKSITHRPDLWGHYGVAREVAAIYGLPLKPYPVTAMEELCPSGLPEISLSIAASDVCRRYCGLKVKGVPTQPAPLWMQLRLGHVGLRPISGLVDLTNYVMVDLGQPMHAFDASLVDRIEVDWAGDGQRFITLDGVERVLSGEALMIQCRGKSVALAGVMGGLRSEVSDRTTTLLLESANFDPVTIRKTAGRLGLRTDASARFEKSLDPAHAALAIQRFVALARDIYPDLALTSRFSDNFPRPAERITVSVNPEHVARTIGREVPLREVSRRLVPLGFQVTGNDTHWSVDVPSFRATNDVSIEADIIEEIARYVGYETIPPVMPRVSMRRFETHALHELERRSLEYFTAVHRYHEIQGYLWYDTDWLSKIGFDPVPCVELKNPPAEGLHRMRQTLMPGLLASVVKNRFYFPALSLVEMGSVFPCGADKKDVESRHIALVSARRGRRAERDLYDRLKGAVEGWAWERFARQVSFLPVSSAGDRPWEHPLQTAEVCIDQKTVGRISVVGASFKHTMDEHLAAWAMAWVELDLTQAVAIERKAEMLGSIPPHPLVEMDFSFLVSASHRYGDIVKRVSTFDHPLLRRCRYLGSYEGDAVGPDQRSLTFRLVIGDPSRTLVEADLRAVARLFAKHLSQWDIILRQS